MNYKKLFYFDIETVTEFENFEELEKENPRKAKNFKVRYTRRKDTSMKFDSAFSAYNGNAMFFPEYGKIVTFSYGFFNGNDFIIKSLSLDPNTHNEKELMIKISETLQKVSELGMIPSGQNIKGFDIPYIVKKLMHYNLKIPQVFQSIGKKPWEVNIVDTVDLWKGMGWDASALDEISETLGLFSPKDDIDGSQVAEIFWSNNDIERIQTYCEKDVKILPEIVKRIYDAHN